MHKIRVELGIESHTEEEPIRVLLDDIELSGVSEVKILSNDEGVTSVSLTLVAVVITDIALPVEMPKSAEN